MSGVVAGCGLVVMVCLVSLLSAQAQEAVKLADEPLHHLKIDNEYVRAYYVEVAPHQETQLHRHDHDYVFVSLGASDVISAVPGKPEVHLLLKDGEIRFARGGFAHVARNMSDAPFRTVAIEFLRPQGEPRNLCDKVVDGPLQCQSVADRLPQDPSLQAVAGALAERRVFETEEILVTSFSSAVQPDFTGPDFSHARLLVVGQGSELKVELPGTRAKTLHGGEVLWLPAGSLAKIQPRGPATRFFMIRFKDADAKGT